MWWNPVKVGKKMNNPEHPGVIKTLKVIKVIKLSTESRYDDHSWNDHQQATTRDDQVTS